MVGLIAQYRTVAILRQGQAEVLQSGNSANRASGFDVGHISVHRATRAERLRHFGEIVAAMLGAGGMQRLFVRTGKGRRPPEQLARHDDDLDAAPLELDRRPQTCCAAAQHDGRGTINRDGEAVEFEVFADFRRRHFPWQRDIGEFVENRLRNRATHGWISC